MDKLPLSFIAYPDRDKGVLVRDSVITVCQNAPHPFVAALIIAVFDGWHYGTTKFISYGAETTKSGDELPETGFTIWYPADDYNIPERLSYINRDTLNLNLNWLLQVGLVQSAVDTANSQHFKKYAIRLNIAYLEACLAHELDRQFQSRWLMKPSMVKEIIKLPEPVQVEPVWVYLFETDRGWHKIGISKNVEQRMQKFATLPFRVKCAHTISTPGRYEAQVFESKLHDKFARKRINGEWFKLDKTDIDYIKTLKDHKDVK